MKLSKPRIEYVYGEGRRISFLLHADSVKEAERLVDSAGDKTLEGVIKVFREKRSLTANAYFHVLVTKIAAALNTDIQSVKKRLVCSYGAVADKDNVPITVTVPNGVDINVYFDYASWIYGDSEGDTYIIYKPTHLLDSREFARLIDATVEEAKQLGIETLPPNELRRLYEIPNEK
jgi:hypothetical protein